MPKKAPAKKGGFRFWTKAFKEPIPTDWGPSLPDPPAGISVNMVGGEEDGAMESVSSENKEDVKVYAKQVWKAYQHFLATEVAEAAQEAQGASVVSDLLLSDTESATLSFSAAPSSARARFSVDRTGGARILVH